MKIEVFQNDYPVIQGRSANLDVDHFAAKKNAEGAMTVQVNHGQLSPEQARDVLLQAIETADRRMEDLGLNIRLRVDEKSERFQLEVYDPETKEVIRRLPPDEIIKLAESIEEMAGVIVDRSL